MTDDVEAAAERLDDAIAWCSAAESGPKLPLLILALGMRAPPAYPPRSSPRRW
jgi:hypothetical protein